MCKNNLGKFDFIFVPIISPFRESREQARKILGNNFIEVYLNCSYEECKKRDTKGLYSKAESGQINNFIGKDISYEPPINPEAIIYSSRENVLESAEKILLVLGLSKNVLI